MYSMNPYQPFNNPYQNQYAGVMPAAPQQQTNVLPPQQVLQANGKASIEALRMSPNSSVLIMDNTAPMVWFCTSDSLGNVTKIPYDMTLHTESQPENTFEKRLTAVEAKLKEVLDAKSYDVGADAK